jgi:Fe2+ or Zn2+ uptake regulation protein
MAKTRPIHERRAHVHDDVPERIEAVLALLRASGGRVTSGRRAIVAALFTGDDHHVTAEDVAERVQADYPDLALSTIYRTLETLEELDVVARVDLGLGSAVYHLVDHVHHHLVCDGCGRVIEVPDDVIAPLARAVDERDGFALSRQRLTLTGLCARCRA